MGDLFKCVTKYNDDNYFIYFYVNRSINAFCKSQQYSLSNA